MVKVALEGYAIPFDAPARIGDLVETIDPAAFSNIGTYAVRFIDNTHDRAAPALATTGHGATAVWCDAHGLAFAAEIDASRTSLIAAIRSGRRCGASVYFTNRQVERSTMNGERRERVIRARLDHITICADPAHAGTGVWLADARPETLPPDIAALRRKWNVGRAAAPQPPRSRRGPTIDPALAAHALSMRKDFPAEAEAWFARAQARTPGRPIIIGHAGLGRADRRPAGIRVRAPWAMVQH